MSETGPVRDSAAALLIPARPTLRNLGAAAAGCQACPLWRSATQTVFGEGPSGARVVFVGEVPGDEEDRLGRPFVGPAGKLLDQALNEAHIDRGAVYLTNVVKHFKWQFAGKRRLHKTPNGREISACRPWLEAELRMIQPELVVCLGATAVQALLGGQFRVSRQRGELLSSSFAPCVMATVHPSSILRIPVAESRRAARMQFVQDLKKAAAILRKGFRAGREKRDRKRIKPVPGPLRHCKEGQPIHRGRTG